MVRGLQVNSSEYMVTKKCKLKVENPHMTTYELNMLGHFSISQFLQDIPHLLPERVRHKVPVEDFQVVAGHVEPRELVHRVEDSLDL